MKDKEDKILEVMHRLSLQKTENGLLTYAVLGEIWDAALEWAEDHDPRLQLPDYDVNKENE